MLKQLRIKFVCIMMTIVTLMLFVILGVIVHFTKINLQENSVQMMHNVAQRPFIPERPDHRVDGIHLPYFIIQQNRDGSFVTYGSEIFDLSDTELMQEISDIAINSKESVGIIKEYDLRYCRVKTPMDEKLVFADISSEIATVNNLVKICVVIGTFSFAGFLVLSLYLSKWAIKPVETAWAQQKQFVADASHELKTPLTVILTNAELIRSSDYSETDKQQFADTLLTMSYHMRSLVEGLLELARVDNGKVKTTMEQLDFSALAEEAILPFEPLFFEKELILNSNIDQGIYLKGSAAHLAQVVNILLDNALKYSTVNTEVTVSLKRHTGSCMLAVSGKGESISAEDLKNIFKRFYRTDKARSRDGSFGLGLAIAESIVKEHDGKIWAESINGTNTFFVQLPL